MTSTEILRVEMLASLEMFAAGMFKAQYGQDFIMNWHHKAIFKALQDVADGKCTRLMINMPPRYSKTETVVKAFSSWAFALNPRCRFLHLSYSDMLAGDNSSAIRQIMQQPLYRELFPGSQLEREKASATRWRTTAGGEFYAVSTQGQVTGFGAGLVEAKAQISENSMFRRALEDRIRSGSIPGSVFGGAVIIDDPIKPEDAASDIARERVNLRFETTIRNRVNSRETPIIIIMQRLHERDLCGYLLAKEPGIWRVLSLPAIYDGKALWPQKHTLEELENIRNIDPVTFDTQYMQNPRPRLGLMYSQGFGEYRPEEIDSLKDKPRYCYIDPADTGSDFLCAVCFINTPDTVYVTDVLYTQEPMEVSSVLVGAMLSKNQVSRVRVEGQAGGRLYAREVKRILRATYKSFRQTFEVFKQGQNKLSRILTLAAGVQSDVRMPEGWRDLWPDFSTALTSYRRDGHAAHDDAPDAVTGVFEMHCGLENRKGLKIRG